MLPCSSQQGAAMIATSIGTSPVTIERARPPWERTVIGQSSSPRLASSPMRPFTPHSSRVMVPLRMDSMISACTGWIELEATVMSRTPRFSTTRTTWLRTSSPFLRWWCVARVMPSRRPARSIASCSVATTFRSPGFTRFKGRVARSPSGRAEYGSQYGTRRLPRQHSGISRPRLFLAMQDGLVRHGVHEALGVGRAQRPEGAFHDRCVDHLASEGDDAGAHLPGALDRLDDLQRVRDLLRLGSEDLVHDLDLARVHELLAGVAERLHELGLAPEPLHVLHVREDGVDGLDAGGLRGPRHAGARVHELLARLRPLDLHAGGVVLGAEREADEARRRARDLDGVDDAERALDRGEDAKAADLEPELLLQLGEERVESLDDLGRVGRGQAHAVRERGEHLAQVVLGPGGVEGVDTDEDLLVPLAVALEEAPHQPARRVLLAVRDRVLEVDDDGVAAEHGHVLQHGGHVPGHVQERPPEAMVVHVCLRVRSMKTVGMPPVLERCRSRPSPRISVSTISQVANTRASRRCPPSTSPDDLPPSTCRWQSIWPCSSGKMLPVSARSSSGPGTSCRWMRGRVMGSRAPVLIPRNVTSCTEPMADTTTAFFTPASCAKSTSRRCRLSPGAILMTNRRPCSTSLNQNPSISAAPHELASTPPPRAGAPSRGAPGSHSR